MCRMLPMANRGGTTASPRCSPCIPSKVHWLSLSAQRNSRRDNSLLRTRIDTHRRRRCRCRDARRKSSAAWCHRRIRMDHPPADRRGRGRFPSAPRRPASASSLLEPRFPPPGYTRGPWTSSDTKSCRK